WRISFGAGPTATAQTCLAPAPATDTAGIPASGSTASAASRTTRPAEATPDSSRRAAQTVPSAHRRWRPRKLLRLSPRRTDPLRGGAGQRFFSRASIRCRGSTLLGWNIHDVPFPRSNEAHESLFSLPSEHPRDVPHLDGVVGTPGQEPLAVGGDRQAV